MSIPVHTNVRARDIRAFLDGVYATSTATSSASWSSPPMSATPTVTPSVTVPVTTPPAPVADVNAVAAPSTVPVAAVATTAAAVPVASAATATTPAGTPVGSNDNGEVKIPSGPSSSPSPAVIAAAAAAAKSNSPPTIKLPLNKKYLSESVTSGVDGVRSRLLTDPTADINEQNKQGITALFAAVMKSDADLVEFLLKAGANVAMFDQSARSPLFIAAQKGQHRILDMLLAHPNKVASASTSVGVGENGMTLYPTSRLITENILDIDIMDNNGSTPLFQAASTGWLYGVKRLLDLGATLGVPGNNERTPSEAMFRWCYDVYRRAPFAKDQKKQFDTWVKDYAAREKVKRVKVETDRIAKEKKEKAAADALAAQEAAAAAAAAKKPPVGTNGGTPVAVAAAILPVEVKKDVKKVDDDDDFDLFGLFDDNYVPPKKPPPTTAATAAAGASTAPIVSTEGKQEYKWVEDIKIEKRLVAGDDGWKPTYEDHATMRLRYNKEDAFAMLVRLLPYESHPINLFIFARRLRVQHMLVKACGGIDGVLKEMERIYANEGVTESKETRMDRVDSALEAVAWHWSRRDIPMTASSSAFALCINRLAASGRESSVRYLSGALLRPMNRQFITSERVTILMSAIQRASQTMLFRLGDWEECMTFVDAFLPVTLKMLLLSHRSWNTDTLEFYATAPPALASPWPELTGTVATPTTTTATTGERKDEKDGKDSKTTTAAASLGDLAATAAAPKKLTSSQRLAERDNRRRVRAQRLLRRDERQRQRVVTNYPAEPAATRIPAAISLEPFAHIFDDLFTALSLSLRSIGERIDLADARRIGVLLHGCYMWQQIFSDASLVIKPLIAERKETKKDEPEAHDPFDVLLRPVPVVVPSTATTAATAATAAVVENQTNATGTSTAATAAAPAASSTVPVTATTSTTTDPEINDDDNVDGIDDYDPSGDGEHASADESTSTGSDHSVANDGRSDDEHDENTTTRRARWHLLRWGQRQPLGTSLPMSYRVYVPDDDVLSIYVPPHRPLSSMIQRFMNTPDYQHGLTKIYDKLKSGYAHYLPFIITSMPIFGLKAKAEYLASVVAGRHTPGESMWKLEIDRMGDAKDVDNTDKKPSAAAPAKRSGESKRVAAAAIIGPLLGTGAAATTTDDGKELRRGTFAHQPHGTGATSVVDEKKSMATGGEVKTPPPPPPLPVADLYRPNRIVEDVMKQIMDAPIGKLYAAMRAKFTGEPGAGDGPTREIFGVIARELFGAHSPFFAPSPDGTCLHIRQTPPKMVNVLRYYEAIGRFLAIAVKDRHSLGCSLSSAIWKSILSREVNWHDLELFDRPTYMAFKSFMDDGMKVDPTWPQYFVYGVEEADGTLRDIELCEGGAKLLLDDTNKQRFVDLWARQRLVDDYLPQITAIVRGFRHLYSKKELLPVTPLEISQLIRGPVKIDLEAMAASVDYGSRFTRDTPQIKWFWQVVGELDEDNLKKLLIFWSGSPVAPLFGFAADEDNRWSLSSRASTSPDTLPEASTCSFQIRMPAYRSLEETRSKIMAAIHYGSVGYTSN